jgi:ankyrin repeat protein
MQPGGSTAALQKTLCSAVDGGKPQIVEQLLDRGVSPDTSPENLALVRATYTRNIPILTLLLEFGADPDRKDEHGETPLRYACEWNHEEEAKLLMDYGADPNLPGVEWAPIAWACYHETLVSLVRLLLSYGADPNIMHPNGYNTIVYAAERCSTSVLEVLVEYGADLNAKTKSGQTALVAAIQWGKVENLKFLLSHGADPNLKGESLPILSAAESPQCLAALIAAGADVHSYKGILELAVWHNQMECVKMLLDAGVNINEKHENNNSPLGTAARDNLPDMLSYLISRGADVNLEGPEIPLRMALDKPQLLKQLLAAGADVKKYKGLMELATWENNLESVKILFEAGVPLNEKHQNIYTPLTTSIRDDHPDIFDFLISKGADPNLEGEGYPIQGALSRPKYLYKLLSAGAKPRNYKGILEQAVYRGMMESVEFLIEAGVDVNEKQEDFYSPITTSIRDNHPAILSLLLSCGADPNMPGEGLPVIQAAGIEDITFLQKLVDAGVDVNKEHSGTFALRQACESNLMDHVKLLLKHGADVNKTGSDGATALDVAAREGHDDMVMLLLDGGH